MEEKKEKKFDCYSCEYRGRVAGSAHICCNHPANADTNADPFLNIVSIFASVGRVAPINITPKELNIKGNAQGIKSGWFNYPLNFDPTWLENCDGYKKK